MTNTEIITILLSVSSLVISLLALLYTRREFLLNKSAFDLNRERIYADLQRQSLSSYVVNPIYYESSKWDIVSSTVRLYNGTGRTIYIRTVAPSLIADDFAHCQIMITRNAEGISGA